MLPSIKGSTSRICAGLRLCPHPRPESLRGVDLRALSDLSLYALKPLGVSSEDVSRVRELFSKPPGSCEFCGAPAYTYVELWDFEVEGSEGRAVLGAVKAACRRCYSVVEMQSSRRFIVDRIARVNGIGIREAEAILEAIENFTRNASFIDRWRFIIEVDGLSHVARSLQNLFDTLRQTGSRLRHGWLVKGLVRESFCVTPVDQGYLIESLRAVGVDVDPALYFQQIPAGVEMRVKWVLEIPRVGAEDALETILSLKLNYVEVSMAVSHRYTGVRVPIEVRLPCYDQLAYHEEAFRVLQKLAQDIGSLEAMLVGDVADNTYRLGLLRVFGP